MLIREVMIEGILSISAGDNPRIVEEKLKAFLSPKEQAVKAEGAEGAEARSGRRRSGINGQKEGIQSSEQKAWRWSQAV